MQRFDIENGKLVESDLGEYCLYREAFLEIDHMHKECDRLLSIIESMSKELEEIKCEKNTALIDS